MSVTPGIDTSATVFLSIAWVELLQAANPDANNTASAIFESFIF